MCIPSHLHQELIFWNPNSTIKVINVDEKNFMDMLYMTDVW
jgi:hypothetical protein